MQNSGRNTIGAAFFLAVALAAAAGFNQSAEAQTPPETVYLNNTNITVGLGSSHDEAVANDPATGPFANVALGVSLDNIINAPAADAGELHDQSEHIWVSGGHLELVFDFGTEYDLLTLHFWNYHQEGYDVDNVAFTFFNSAGEQVGGLEVEPRLGNSSGTDADPLFAEDYELDFPGNVHYVNAWLTGSNNQVDFNNIGFTAVLSERPDSGQTAPQQTGSGGLAVLAETDTATARLPGDGAIEVILDASGSMWQQLDGRYRYEIAAEVLTELVTDVLPAEVPFALRVFGNREADVCRTDLELALAPLDVAAVTGVIAGIEPQQFAGTPLAESIALVRGDLAEATGAATVILITDGEESCDGDVEAAISDLRADGFDVVLNIIGFDFDAGNIDAAREQFRSWADLGGGQYFDARNAAELASALEHSVSPVFEVLDGDGVVVARGTVGGTTVRLEAGTYSVRVLTEPALALHDVQVDDGETSLDLSDFEPAD